LKQQDIATADGYGPRYVESSTKITTPRCVWLLLRPAVNSATPGRQFGWKGPHVFGRWYGPFTSVGHAGAIMRDLRQIMEIHECATTASQSAGPGSNVKRRKPNGFSWASGRSSFAVQDDMSFQNRMGNLTICAGSIPSAVRLQAHADLCGGRHRLTSSSLAPPTL